MIFKNKEVRRRRRRGVVHDTRIIWTITELYSDYKIEYKYFRHLTEVQTVLV